MILAYTRRAELADLLEEVLVADEEERQPRRELIDVHASRDDFLAIGDREGQDECDFLHGVAADVGQVIAAEADRVDLRRRLGAVHDEIAQQPDGLTHRIDPLLLRDVFLQRIRLQRAGELAQIAAALLRHADEHRVDDPGGRVDRQRNGNLLEIDAVEQPVDVFDRVDGDADASDFTKGLRVVRIKAE